MEPLRKQLTCPGCGKTAEVRVLPGVPEDRWQCPNCKKLQKSDQAALDAAPAL
jgi:ribosomal protein L37AE/L43A